MEASRRVMRMPTHTDSGSSGSQSQLELNLDTALHTQDTEWRILIMAMVSDLKVVVLRPLPQSGSSSMPRRCHMTVNSPGPTALRFPGLSTWHNKVRGSSASRQLNRARARNKSS